jgi:hypothetical protein
VKLAIFNGLRQLKLAGGITDKWMKILFENN